MQIILKGVKWKVEALLITHSHSPEMIEVNGFLWSRKFLFPVCVCVYVYS